MDKIQHISKPQQFILEVKSETRCCLCGILLHDSLVSYRNVEGVIKSICLDCFCKNTNMEIKVPNRNNQ